MTIHNDITVPVPWKSREFDRVLQNFLQVPCFLSLGQVELVATASNLHAKELLVTVLLNT